MAVNLSDWHCYPVLPVRNSSGVYLGTVTRSVLRTALEKTPSANVSLGDSLLSHLARAMVVTATGMVQMAPGSHASWLADKGGSYHDD